MLHYCDGGATAHTKLLTCLPFGCRKRLHFSTTLVVESREAHGCMVGWHKQTQLVGNDCSGSSSPSWRNWGSIKGHSKQTGEHIFLVSLCWPVLPFFLRSCRQQWWLRPQTYSTPQSSLGPVLSLLSSVWWPPHQEVHNNSTQRRTTPLSTLSTSLCSLFLKLKSTCFLFLSLLRVWIQPPAASSRYDNLQHFRNAADTHYFFTFTQ